MPIVETYKFKFTPWTEGKPEEYALILCKDRAQTVGNALCVAHPYRLWHFTNKNGDFKPTHWCDLSKDVKRITKEEVESQATCVYCHSDQIIHTNSHSWGINPIKDMGCYESFDGTTLHGFSKWKFCPICGRKLDEE